MVVNGAKITTIAALKSRSSQKLLWIAPVLSKSRSAVTKWLTGLRLTKVCKNLGSVLTGMKAFERKVRSIITVIEMPVIAAELLITYPIKAKIQLIDQLKKTASAIARMTDNAFPPICQPRTRPVPMTNPVHNR